MKKIGEILVKFAEEKPVWWTIIVSERNREGRWSGKKFRVEWRDGDGHLHDDEVRARSRWFARRTIVIMVQPYPVDILHIRKVS